MHSTESPSSHRAWRSSFGKTRTGVLLHASLTSGTRDVTFNYPGSDTSQPAVRNVSFKLPPGALVVIVGSNGSGKSSLVNLLSGLYAPTSGTILYNGIPSSKKRARQTQNSAALLTQDHTLFQGLSVGENIGMGDPENVKDMSRIREAARMGGALEFIENKCPGQFDEVLTPIYTLYSSYWPIPELFKGVYDKIEVSRSVSGGEEQRLAAWVASYLVSFEKSR